MGAAIYVTDKIYSRQVCGSCEIDSGRSSGDLFKIAPNSRVFIQRLPNRLINCERRLLSQSGRSYKHQHEKYIYRHPTRYDANRLELFFIDNLVTSSQRIKGVNVIDEFLFVPKWGAQSARVEPP
jgi:hypothetical protein